MATLILSLKTRKIPPLKAQILNQKSQMEPKFVRKEHEITWGRGVTNRGTPRLNTCTDQCV